MIRDLSETLKALLTQPGLPSELASAQIVFERPVESFNPTQTTIDLFLYDVRENMELRSNEPYIERSNGIAVIHRPPLRVACTYLVTAWPVGGAELSLQEHRLLSQVLQVLSGYPQIPETFLKGSLKGQQPALPMMAAKVGEMKDPVEFWAAIGNKLRTSISVTATIAFASFTPETSPTVLTSNIKFGERTASDEQKLVSPSVLDSYRIAGLVIDAGDSPVPVATVTVVETGFTTTSGEDGSYQLGMFSSGVYTINVQTGAKTKNFTVTIPAAQGQGYNLRV